MSKNGYEPIPDLKECKSSPSPSQHNSVDDPQERYPEANEEEAELLGLLDQTMEEPSVHIELPQLKKDEVGISSGFWTFLCVMLPLPTLVLLLNSCLAIWITTDAMPPSLEVSVPYFPYLAAMLGFFGSLVPVRHRYRTQAEEVASLIETTPPVAIDTVRNVVLSVASKVDMVKMRLNLVVDTMRPKFAAAHKASADLRAMDPNIIIPDPRDVETELENAKEEIDESIKIVEKTLPVRSWIPDYLKSSQQFERRRSTRVLVVFLILQLVSAYAVTVLFPMTPVSAEESEIVQSLWHRIRLLCTFKNVEGDAGLLWEDVAMMLDAAFPVPLIYGVVAFGVTILQLILVLCWTSASTTAHIVNGARSSVSEQTNHVLRQHGIIFLCQDILEIRMGRVKNKLLTMIQQLYKIDMLMSLTSDSRSSPPRARASPAKASSPVVSPSGRQRRGLGSLFGNSSKSTSPPAL